jgi:phospholipase/carboxylesterase
MRTIKVAELTVRLTGGTDGAGGGDGPLVVLCHGFGAGGDDLVPLGDLMRAPAGVRVAFPAAPLALPMFGNGRAWWMIDLGRYDRAMRSGKVDELKYDEPDGMVAAREQLVATIDALAGTAPVVLGGFSQGAMLSCDVALRTARPLAALILMSTSFQVATAWRAGMAARAGLPVLQSHGRQDPLLPYGMAADLSREMTEAGIAVDFLPFDGGHEIPMPVVARAGELIRRVLG